MSYHYNAAEGVRQIDADLYAAWIAAGNPKADYWTPIPDPPGPGYRYDGTDWIAPPPPPVPQQVTAFQARAALHAAGLLDTVQAAIDASPDRMVQLAWEHALHFERNSPTVAAMAATLNLTGSQIDDLFVAASAITA